MDRKIARSFFIWGTVVCTAVFIWLTIDTHTTIPRRTNTDKLTDDVVLGKRVWHKYNCNDCHTILGIGGYYAPDVTKVYSVRGEEWLKAFLRNPESPNSERRKMPNQGLSQDEIAKLIAFLKWVDTIDTNEWPPRPVYAERKRAAPIRERDLSSKGRELYHRNRCDMCHRIDGKGGVSGPDLSGIGGRRGIDWLAIQIRDPKAHNPETRMPSYPQLADEDVRAIVEFLAGLR